MFAIFSNIDLVFLGQGASSRKPHLGGYCPRPVERSYDTVKNRALTSLADEDGLTARLLDCFLSCLGELMGVDRNRNLNLSIIQNLDETVLLA